MYLGDLEEWDVYKRWISDSEDPDVPEPLKKFLCLEETDHCADDPWGDFGNVVEKGSFFWRIWDDALTLFNRRINEAKTNHHNDSAKVELLGGLNH